MLSEIFWRFHVSEGLSPDQLDEVDIPRSVLVTGAVCRRAEGRGEHG